VLTYHVIRMSSCTWPSLQLSCHFYFQTGDEVKAHCEHCVVGLVIKIDELCGATVIYFIFILVLVDRCDNHDYRYST
jgi:hypothetical protein